MERVQPRHSEIRADVAGCRVTRCRSGNITLRHFRQIEQADGIRVGDHVPGKRLPRSDQSRVWRSSGGVIGLGWVVNGEAHGRKVSDPFGAGGNGIVLDALELLLLRVLVIRKEEEFVLDDGSADGSAFLVTVESRRSIALSAGRLTLLIEIVVRGQDVGPEYSKPVAMKLVGAGLAD